MSEGECDGENKGGHEERTDDDDGNGIYIND